MKKKHVYIDQACYENLLEFLEEENVKGKAGKEWDLDLFNDNKWLRDSIVVDTISMNKQKNNWDIYLNFICMKAPFKIIRRKITSHSSLKKAHLAADIFRRQAGRDPRGTTEIKPIFFEICDH